MGLSVVSRQGFGWQQELKSGVMWFVYILRSMRDGNLYVGSTNNMERRLADHNSGQVDATRSRRPFMIEAYLAVKDKPRAIELEKYFKTGSGKAVLLKRIL